jgi:hypothetical protein
MLTVLAGRKPERGFTMSSFLTFDSPRARGGMPIDDPLAILNRCATLGDVHRAFPDVASILVPFFGAASAHGATRPVVRSFARLLQHPLGPSVAAEALSLVAGAAGFVHAPGIAAFFEHAATATSSRRPIERGHRLLIRDRLTAQTTPTRRLGALIRWWDAAHDERCSWTFPEPGYDPNEYWWSPVPLALISWLALATARQLADHLPWMPAEVCDEVARDRRLFDRREDLEGLAWLVANHPLAILANPLCPETLEDALTRRQLPVWVPPVHCPDHVEPLSIERWEWATRSTLCNDEPVPSWMERGSQIGWLSVAAARSDFGDVDAHRALVPANERPDGHLLHAAGQPEPAVRGESGDPAFAVRLAAALHGATIHEDTVWRATVLRTFHAIWTNADDMGNCTARYYGPPEETGTILFLLDDGNRRLNADVTYRAPCGWHMRAINSRFNAGDVPKAVSRAFASLVSSTAARLESRTTTPRTMQCVQCETGRAPIGRVCVSCRDEHERPYGARRHPVRHQRRGGRR